MYVIFAVPKINTRKEPSVPSSKGLYSKVSFSSILVRTTSFVTPYYSLLSPRFENLISTLRRTLIDLHTQHFTPLRCCTVLFFIKKFCGYGDFVSCFGFSISRLQFSVSVIFQLSELFSLLNFPLPSSTE